jgi:hypothetical protein
MRKYDLPSYLVIFIIILLGVFFVWSLDNFFYILINGDVIK